jgi:hypothetical protein
MKSDLVDILVTVQHQTDKAVLVDHGGEEAVWLPLSQIEIEPDTDGKSHIVTLPEWLAADKELI